MSREDERRRSTRSNTQRNTKGKKHKSKKQRRKKKMVIFAIEIVVILILLVILFGWLKLSRINTKKLNENKMIINELESDDGYTSIAVFGLDNRSNGKLEKGNSDVIMIASINDETKEVKLCSVYRDTY
ncbi:MAG: LytR family transcriptional regulator, partial [Lachnospiraceae bacterium]